MELEAAIFDFGGVLTTPIRASFAAFESRFALPEGTLLRAFISHEPDEEPEYFLLERGQITEAEFFARMCRRIADETGIDISDGADPASVRPQLFAGVERNEEMILAAASIGQHYKTAILTNNVKEWVGWREMVDAHVFDVVVDSSEVGVRKPEPEIYRLTCERLGVAPARAAFVDDLIPNVEGAAAQGLHAIRFTTTDEVLDTLRPFFPRAFESHEEKLHA